MSEATPATTQRLPADFDRRAFFTKIGLGSLGIAAARLQSFLLLRISVA